MNGTQTLEDLFTRDGHLTELTIDRYLVEELSLEQHQAVDDHLQECDDCRGEVQAARAFYDEVSADLDEFPQLAQANDDTSDEAPAQVVNLADERRQRRKLWLTSAAAIACAVALVIAIFPQQTDRADQPTLVDDDLLDRVQLRGSGLSLEVWVDTDDDPPRRAMTGETIHPGNRLGFRLSTDEPGDILVVGVDGAGQAYLGFPHDTGGSSRTLDAMPDGELLDGAVQVGPATGTEWILALRCEDSIHFDELQDHLRDLDDEAVRGLTDELPPGCQISSVRLNKSPRP